MQNRRRQKHRQEPRGGNEIPVIFVIRDGLVGAPLDDKTAVLDKRLSFLISEGLDAGDGGVCHWKGSPAVAGHAGTGREGQERIFALRVARGCEGDGAQGAVVESVCGVGVFEHLHVGPKLKRQCVEIRWGGACNKQGGTHGGRNTGRRREHVEATDDVEHHAYHHDFWKALKRQTVNTGT